MTDNFHSCMRNFIVLSHKNYIENSTNNFVWSDENITLSPREYDRFSPDQVSVCSLPKDADFLINLMKIYLTIWTVSIICIVLNIIVHLLLSTRRRHHTIVLQCHLLTLFFLYVCFLLHPLNKNPKREDCIVATAFMRYLFASSTAWLNVIGFSLWRKFGKVTSMPQTVKSRWRRLVGPAMYAVGIPFVLITAGTILDATNVLRSTYMLNCWPRQSIANNIFYYAPVIAGVLVNMVFLVLLIIRLRNFGSNTFIVNNQTNVQLWKAYFKIVLTLGAAFLLSMICWFEETDDSKWPARSWPMYAIDCICNLQGVYVSILYVCRKSVWQELRNSPVCKQRILRPVNSSSGEATTQDLRVSRIKVEKCSGERKEMQDQ